MKKVMMLVLLLGWVSLSSAQDLVTDFLKKNNDPKIFTQVNISSKMFQMISDITDAEIESLIRNLHSLKILSTEKEAQRYFGEVMNLVNRRENGYEELMSIVEEGQDVRMFIREKNKVINELVVLVGSKEEFMLMNFCGIIDLKKISKLTQAVNIEGLEYLNKVNNDK